MDASIWADSTIRKNEREKIKKCQRLKTEQMWRANDSPDGAMENCIFIVKIIRGKSPTHT